MALVTSEEALTELVGAYSNFSEFVFDVETTGEHRGDALRNDVVWLSMAGPGRADVIPMGHPVGELITPEEKVKEPWWDEENPTKTGKPRKKWRTVLKPATFTPAPPQLDRAVVFDALKPLFLSDRRKIGQNVKFDVKSVAKYLGELPHGPYGDTMIGEFLLNESKTHRRDLGALSSRYLDYDFEDKGIGARVEAHGFSVVSKYSYLDAKNTWLVWKAILPRLKAEGLMGVLDLEMDVLEAVCDMEMTGAFIDMGRVKDLLVKVDDQCDRAMVRIYKEVGHEINLNSPKQKAALLFKPKSEGGRGHAPHEFTKTGQPSTAADALAPLAKKDKLIEDMLYFSEWDKIRGTYLRSWIEKNVNGRVYSEFNQARAETGRFTSREPNLQNVPRRGDKSDLIRSLFVAPPGKRLVVADYSQIELRVMAHYTRDKTLTAAFIEGRDPHGETASLLFGIPLEDIEDWMRDVAKTINFGIAYGAGSNKVAATANISKRRADAILEQHRRVYPAIYRWKDDVVKQCRRRKPPHVTTLMGRKRRLPHIMSRDNDTRASAERQAVNTVVQGSSADIMKLAIVRLHQTLPPDMDLVLTVHDELMVETPEDRADDAVAIMEDAMVGPGIGDMLDVPLTTDVHVVTDWSAK